MNAMNTTNAPTQPPDKCPACKSEKMPKSNDIDTWYECAQLYQLVDGVWKPNAEWSCNRSFSAAIALRQKLADEKTANECLQDELTVLRAESDAALAELEGAHALLDRVGVPRGFPEGDDNEGLNYALQYRINIIDEVLKLRDEAKRYSAHLEHESAALAVLHSNAVDERDAALVRLAELQAVCDAAWNDAVDACAAYITENYYPPKWKAFGLAENMRGLKRYSDIAALASGAESEMTK